MESGILSVVMRIWSLRKFVAFLLALFVNVGVSLSAIQATDMTVTMAMAPHMSAMAKECCYACPSGRDGDSMKTMACGIGCIASQAAMLAEGVSMPVISAPTSFLVYEPLFDGKRAQPDPYPPRTTDIG
jgi:hypothetical protein